MTRTTFFVLISLLVLAAPVWGQRLELGAGGGIVNYKGDISPDINLRYPRPGGHIFLRHNPGKAVSLTYSLMLGKFSGSDKDSQDLYAKTRNLSFNTRLLEGSAIAEYNFLNYRDEIEKTPFSPFLFAGVALFRFEPIGQYKVDYTLTQIGIPFGVGVKYVLGGNWNLNVALGARKTFTDYLDNLGGGIDVNNRFANGNPYDKDMYFYSSVSVSYTFYKVRCPEFY